MSRSNNVSFGGMERAFSAKTMRRHVKYFRYVNGKATADSWKEPPQTTNKDKKRKKSMREVNSPFGHWASLDDNLLHSIIMRLNIVDYFAVGAVCRSWRSVATSSTDVYMKQQKPLVIVISKWAKRTCFLYDIFDGEEYKTLLPDMQNKCFVGLSCGYLITLKTDKYDFWLINLMTKHELCYPALPDAKKYNYYNCCSILFKSTWNSQVFMIVFFKGRDRLWVSQNGAKRWRVYTITNATRGIEDVKVFNKKIYVVSIDAHICVLDFNTSPVMKFYNGNISTEKTCTHLVIMENQLCLRARARATDNSTLNILYELDDKDMVWVEKKEMGKYSLFRDGMNATMVDTSNWGASNCICTLSPNFDNKWSLRRLDHAKRSTYAPVVWSGDPKLVVWFWYFPDKSYDIDHVDD